MKSFTLYSLLLFSLISKAQCPYPNANTQLGATQTFCVNNPNQVITVNNMNGSRFLLVNVVQGFTYNFSVGNVYAANNENLNVYDASTNTALVFASGASGASISNWVSTLSGQIKLVLSLDACIATNLTNVQVTIEIVNVGNTIDNQTDFGTNTWVGHVYNWLGTSPPPGGSTSPASPTYSYPFDVTSYAGYYPVNTESINEAFGSNSNCFPLYSNGAIRTNILTDVFAVRYKMRSTRPAGCYIATLTGDDGMRLYNDGVLVFNSWRQQSITSYFNVLIYLDGSADLVYDYYEYQGENAVAFSLTPFNSSLNDIVSPVNPIVCSGVTPLPLNGSSFLYNGTTINPTIAFQWQSSTDNITFTNITGATNEDYTPPGITSATTVVTYYRRLMSAVSNVGSCSFASNSVSITTTGAPASIAPVALAGSGATCGQFTANWNAYAGATSYQLDVSTNTSFTTFVDGFNGLNVGNVNTYVVTGLAGSTAYYYRVRAISSCGISNVSNRITLLVIPPPTVVSATSGECNQFTANWTASINATSYIIDVATTSGFTTGTYLTGYTALNVGNVTTITVAGVTVYPVYYRIRGVGLCGTSGNSTTTTVNATSTTWNGSTWSNGLPTMSKTVTINGTYDMNTQPSFDACNVIVNSPFVVTVPAGRYINIQNNLTVNTGATVNVLNGGSLVQISDAAINTGNINMSRTASIRLWDYVFWSSPVNNFTLANVSPATPSQYIWRWNTTVANANGGLGNWQNATGTMTNGVGYILRAPAGYSTSVATSYTANFVGVPNNGVYTPTIERGSYTGANYTGTNGAIITSNDDNWNLVGNPYPSAISINSFLTFNTNIDGFVRIWTHGTLPSTSISSPFYNTFGYNYSPADYLVLNGTGSNSGPGLSAVIGAGQGFFVLMNPGTATTSTLTFNNAMRDKTYYNEQFYRNVTAKNNIGDYSTADRIWLDLISPIQTTRTLIGYIDGATQERDRLYDAITDYKDAQNFYSLVQDDPMTIQGRGLPFMASDQVPLGIKTPQNGNYTIAIGAVEGLFSANNQAVYLEDKKLNIIHNLSIAPYTFTEVKTIENNRFVLRYTNQTLANTNYESIQNSVAIYASNNQVKIDSTIENILEYEIYDVLGRTLTTKKELNANHIVINTIAQSNQALIVKITMANDQVLVKKIVY
jgi:hypothetical protein